VLRLVTVFAFTRLKASITGSTEIRPIWNVVLRARSMGVTLGVRFVPWGATLTQVSQTLRIAPVGTNRLPNVILIDLNVRKTFRLPGQLVAEPVVEVFNLTKATRSRTAVPSSGPRIIVWSAYWTRMWDLVST
jgi:hypothetical protein